MSRSSSALQAAVAVKSPCVNICVLDSSQQLCTGCGRLIGEIVQWGGASESCRAQIVAAAARRLQTLEAAPNPNDKA